MGACNVFSRVLECERVVLFDEDYLQSFSDYDDFGLRLTKLRFYPNT